MNREISNVILIVVDSLRQDHVSYYNRGDRVFENVPACRTPNIDEFAAQSIAFRNIYPCGLPTIPVRTELMTGGPTLGTRDWQPLNDTDLTAAEILSHEGFVCGFLTDTYHYWAPGMNFHRFFHSYQWVRGEEYDPYVSAMPKRDVKNYINENYSALFKGYIAQYLANTEERQAIEKRFTYELIDKAIAWLRSNKHHRKLFLWLDSFKPHEPWDPPAEFDRYIPENYSGPRLILPMGGLASSWASPAEMDCIRGLYAGEVAFVDFCLGRLFNALEDLGFFENSLIVLLSDHGHPLADHGKFLKGSDRVYGELLKVPLLIRFPGGERGGEWSDIVASFYDILPTILNLVGLEKWCDLLVGKPFLGRTGEILGGRRWVISGYFKGKERAVRTKRWSMICINGEPRELYDLRQDPLERVNVIEQHYEEACELLGKIPKQLYAPWAQMLSRTHTGLQGYHESRHSVSRIPLFVGPLGDSALE